MPFLRAPLVAAIVALSVAAGPPEARGGAPSPIDLVRTIDVRECRLSPAGDRVAFVAADSLDPTLYQIWMVDTGGGTRPHPFTAGGRSAREPVWSPDGLAMLFLSARSDTAPEQIQRIGTDGGESGQLTGEPGGVLAMAWSPDGKTIAYTTPGLPVPPGDPVDGSVGPPGVRLRVRDAATGATRTISPDSTSVWRFQWSPGGDRLAVTFTRPGRFGEWRRGMLAVVRPDGSEWRRVPGRADPLQEPAFSPDGRRIAFYALPGATGGYPVLHTYDPRKGNLVRLAPPDWRGTDEGVIWTGTGLFVNAFRGVRCVIARVDPETGSRTDLVERWSRAGSAGNTFSVARNGCVAWLGEGPDHPADVFVFDPKAGVTRRLSDMNPRLETLDLARPSTVSWTSFDGRSIEGLLFTPPDSVAAAPWPLVVQPHGGPAWNWTLGFYDDAHYPGLLLASRGYAVLYPNPRGSTGYGEEFKRLDEGDLGGGDFRDILAGIDSLAAAGTIDTGRVAIAGFSYGGYMSAWAVGNSDRFRCAVVGAGPMDLYSDYAGNELSPWWQEEFLGTDPYADPETYLTRSPIAYAGRIRCPVLILHGAEDERVPVSQSRELFRALRSAGGTVEFYIYPREGHGLLEPAHRLDLVTRQLDWFERHLK